MKTIIEYHKLSTGYVHGNYSGPPIFDKDNIKPIPASGSDSIYYPDNRLSKDNKINEAYNRMYMLNKLGKGYVGFIMYYGNDLYDMRPYYKSRSDLKANY